VIVPCELAASSAAAVSPLTTRIEVGLAGAIQSYDETSPGREVIAKVTSATFYSCQPGPIAGRDRAQDRLSLVTDLTMAVDLNAIADAVKAAQRNEGQPDDPDKRVYVGREGEMLLGDEATGAERIAEVTGDTFYHLAAVSAIRKVVNLAGIAAAVRRAQRNGGRFVDPSKRVYVGREGELYQGCMATGGQRISEVTSDTFFSPPRLETESAFVRSNMPRNTIRVSDGTYDGWHFTMQNEFGDSYSLFLYYHASYRVYRAVLIEPRMQGTVDVHGSHLWPDGTLCLTYATGSGYPSMAATYAKAALWTRGASCYRRGYGFQFNVGQD
jgi:hypothetical protein